MNQILAIDYGLKRSGLAYATEPILIAHPLKTVLTKQIDPYLENYFLKNKVETIVIGFPSTLRHESTDATNHVNAFKQKLIKKYPAKNVVLYDERFSSLIAKKSMIEGNFKKSERRKKENIDVIAATIILQDYIRSFEIKVRQKHK